MQFNLNQLAHKYNCDKNSDHHNYCNIYEKYLDGSREHYINFLELGYGGYQDPNAGGESARMWREYFKHADITVLDLYPKNNIPERVMFVCGRQDIESSFDNLPKYFDVIVDDASHVNDLTIKSFNILWNRLCSGGLYFIEDLHSSYDTYYPDAEPNPSKGNTTMNFLKRIIDGVNNEFLLDEHKLTFNIEFIHFYKDLAVIKKL